MKNIIIILIFNLLFTPNSIGQQIEIPTAEILTNTFIIQTDTMFGTCFLVMQNDSEYIVTARHLFKKTINGGDSISFHIGRGTLQKDSNNVYEIFELFKGKVYLHDNPNIDIAIIKLSNKLSYLNPYEFSTEGSILGQDCYFLGFPYQKKYSTTNRGQSGRFAFEKKSNYISIL